MTGNITGNFAFRIACCACSQSLITEEELNNLVRSYMIAGGDCRCKFLCKVTLNDRYYCIVECKNNELYVVSPCYVVRDTSYAKVAKVFFNIPYCSDEEYPSASEICTILREELKNEHITTEGIVAIRNYAE